MKNGERTVAARIAQFEMTGSKFIAKDSSPTDEQENRQNITTPPLPPALSLHDLYTIFNSLRLM